MSHKTTPGSKYSSDLELLFIHSFIADEHLLWARETVSALLDKTDIHIRLLNAMKKEDSGTENDQQGWERCYLDRVVRDSPSEVRGRASQGKI